MEFPFFVKSCHCSTEVDSFSHFCDSSKTKVKVFVLRMDGWMDLLVGTGVATALRIVQWISNWNCYLTFLPKLHIACSLRCHPNKSVGKLGLGWLQTLKYCSIDKKKICGFISFFGDQSRWLFESLWWNWALDEKYFPADICSPPSQKEIFKHWNI